MNSIFRWIRAVLRSIRGVWVESAGTTLVHLGRFALSPHECHEIYSLTNQKYFLTARLRPVRVQETDPKQVFYNEDSVAIVIQGPVIRAHRFTLETVLLYKKIFPGSTIILSTWDEEEGSEIDGAVEAGADVVLSARPTHAGLANHNLQMQSSHAGLFRARELGLKYALKTRSDQRLHNPLSVSTLKRLLTTFPLEQSQSTAQTSRIIFPSFNSFAFLPFHLSDMLQFGATADVLNFWDGTFDQRAAKNLSVNDPNETVLAVAKRRVGEAYFLTRFLEKTGWDCEWTLQNYWEACVARFLIVDAASLDLFWPKYSLREERWKRYDFAVSHQEFDFGFWLRLVDEIPAMEIFLEQKATDVFQPLGREAVL